MKTAEETATVAELQAEIKAWADSVFPHRTMASAMLKLYEELGELLRAPHDPDEHADVYILLLDISSMMGVDVAASVRRKIGTNKERTWSVSKTGTMQHTNNTHEDGRS